MVSRLSEMYFIKAAARVAAAILIEQDWLLRFIYS
jgi:hypothetical protein